MCDLAILIFNGQTFLREKESKHFHFSLFYLFIYSNSVICGEKTFSSISFFYVKEKLSITIYLKKKELL